MAEGCTKFVPSLAQLRALAAYQDAGYADTDVATCERAEVPRRTYYEWWDHPEFVEWWLGKERAFRGRQRARVRAAIFTGATEKDAPGDPRDRKTFLEAVDPDFAPTTKQKNENSGTITIRVEHEEIPITPPPTEGKP